MKIFIIHFLITLVAGFALHDSLSGQMSGGYEFAVYLSIFLLLWLSSFLYRRDYFRKFYRLVSLLMFFAKELLVSNFKVIYYVITPRLQFRPAILKFPLRIKSERGIALLANLITLTPGTITLEVSRDRKYLYFHIIDVTDGDPEVVRQRIRDGFENRILSIMG